MSPVHELLPGFFYLPRHADIVGLSFCQGAADVRQLRERLAELALPRQADGVVLHELEQLEVRRLREPPRELGLQPLVAEFDELEFRLLGQVEGQLAVGQESHQLL